MTLAMIISIIEELLGREIPVLDGISAMRCTTSADRAALIRNMLILRALAGDEGFSAVKQLVEEVHKRFNAIAQMRASCPSTSRSCDSTSPTSSPRCHARRPPEPARM